MLGVYYPTKKELKQNIGKKLNFVETSLFGREYKQNGVLTVVGPNPFNNRKYYAQVTIKDDLIIKVT